MNGESRARVVAFLLATAIFVGGIASGIAIDRWFFSQEPETTIPRGPPRSPEEAVRRFERSLDLDPDQVEKVAAIVAFQWEETGRVLVRFDPEMEAIRLRSLEQIEAILRPDQATRFEEMSARFEGRRARMRERLSLPQEPEAP